MSQSESPTKWDKFTQKQIIYIPERLKEMLRLAARRPATVVEAPTGYGKSVAVREFTRHTELPVKWINIYDGDMRHAWKSLCLSFFDNSKLTEEFLCWPFPEDGSRREHFANAMKKAMKDQPFILVVDDYHAVLSEQTNWFFRYLVREMPETFHIIMISQKIVFPDEEILLSTGKLNRITTADLCLSLEDLHEYLKLCEVPMPEKDITLLYKKSEGWISMIYVSVLNYLRIGKSDLSADMEHLVERVAYATCSQQSRHFLSYMALMQDFTKEQADFFNQGEDSEAILTELQNNHSFFGVDPQTGFYHMHTIFRGCVMHHFDRLSLGEKCVRFEKVAEYYLHLKQYNKALIWYKKAENYEGVLHTLDLFETIGAREEDENLMRQCFDGCPVILFEDYPQCLILFMWRFYNYHDEERLQTCLELFEKIMSQLKLAREDMNYLRRAYYVFRGQMAYNNLEEMDRYMHLAIAVPAENMVQIDRDIPRTFGIPSILHMFYHGGEMTGILRIFKEHVGQLIENDIYCYEGLGVMAEAEWKYLCGAFAEAEILCHKGLRICRKHDVPGLVISAQYLNAHLAYMRNDYDEVKNILDCMRSHVTDARCENSRLHYTVDMAEAFFYIYMGYPEHVADWIFEEDVFPKRLMYQAYPFAMLMKMNMALYQERYTEILSGEDEVKHISSQYHYLLTEADFYLVFASSNAALGRYEEAIALIRKVKEMIGIEPEMTYAKYGKWLMKPIQMLVEEDESFKGIMAMCRKFSLVQKEAKKQEHAAIFPMLSKRENDIALFAVDGCTNKEIASQLFISENTVKSSMKNIFVKLGIASRRDLLKIAQMGIESVEG